ncbi:MAG: hypothetical protein IJA97_02400 [Clostridia bacterium]|nr:hypothetical protein [Clostridia bacterium]
MNNNGNNNKGENFNDLDKICWGLFERTGHIGYYFLYNKAKENRKSDIKKEKE